MQDPSQLHLGWDVIETLICSFQAVYCPRIDGIAVSAMHAFLDSVKPAIQGSPVPESYYHYWRQRQRRHLPVEAEEVWNPIDPVDTMAMMDVEEAMGTVDSTAVDTKDLMNATKRTWFPQGPDESLSLVDVNSDEQSLTTIKSVHEEPPPAYLPPSPSEPRDKWGTQVSKADVGQIPSEKPTEELSQTLARGNAQCDSLGQNENAPRKSWLRRFLKNFQPASGS